MQYEAVIGLEIHAELKTRTKMFCRSLNDPNEKHPNINVCPVCLGHPGILPIINEEAIRKVIQIGLALEGSVSPLTFFERKNYFYPDLPKGYQISQYQAPLIRNASLTISPIATSIAEKKIRIERIHLEEDTARSIHDTATKTTLIDFNRAGIPLMELVTEPDLHSGEEVRLFGETLQQILRYLDVSDANMEQGQMRVEVNISLHEANAPRSPLGTKVEIKNINSFRFAAAAVDYEVRRQTELLSRGEKVIQETRGWDEQKGVTFSQRLKEDSHDYRYFPEPDLPPIRISDAMVAELMASLPELPQQKLVRFQNEFSIEPKLAATIIADRKLAAFFEATVSELKEWLASTGTSADTTRPMQLAANYLTTDLVPLLGSVGTPIEETLVTPENFSELISYIFENRISSRAAKEILKEMFRTGADPSIIIDERKLWQASSSDDSNEVIQKVVTEEKQAVLDYKAGKSAALQFLLGRIMKEKPGANPSDVRETLERMLKE